MNHWLARVVRFTAGATVAGAAVGLAEGLFRQLPWGLPLGYAVVFYAAMWALGGAALGAALAWRETRYPLTWGTILAGAGSAGVLVRFILWRDVFAEAPGRLQVAWAGGLLVALLLAALLWAVVSRLEVHLPAPAVSVAPVGAWVLFAVLAWPQPEAHDSPLRHPHSKPAPGVILVVVDALRADALGVYGAKPHRGAPATPHLDAFATDAVVYTHATAQASWTKPAMASLMTSRYVRGHHTMAKAAMLPSTLPTLASELQRHGVTTGAVVTNYNLEAAFGFDRGFTEFDYLAPARYLNAPSEAGRLAAYNAYRLVRERLFKASRQSQYFYRSANWVNDAALGFLDRHPGAPFFLWLHYMEPHDPYFADDGTSWARVSNPHPAPEDAPAMQSAYRDGVRRFDTAFGELLTALQVRGLDAKTTFIITADHGEEFGEHAGFYHGTSLYEELVHVPLLLKGPALAPAVHEGVVQQIDVAPTILQHFDVVPPASWEGTGLLRPALRELAWAEEDHDGHILSAIRQDTEGDSFKLILANPDNPRGLPPQALYDLRHDPGEQAPLPTSDPRAETLLRRLRALKDPGRAGGPAAVRPLDPAAQAELRSLGYIQ